VQAFDACMFHLWKYPPSWSNQLVLLKTDGVITIGLLPMANRFSIHVPSKSYNPPPPPPPPFREWLRLR